MDAAAVVQGRTHTCMRVCVCEAKRERRGAGNPCVCTCMCGKHVKKRRAVSGEAAEGKA